MEYPKRDPFFAHKTVRLMHKTAVPSVIGRDAFCLVCIILHTEDAARYRGPVAFWNSVLMETLGFTRWETFNNARKKAVEGGWLRYSGDGKRQPGMYFVTVPDGYEMVSDDPIEPVSYPESGYKSGYDAGYKAGYDAGVMAYTKASQTRCDGVEPFIPTPDPCPTTNTGESVAVAPAPVSEVTPKKQRKQPEPFSKPSVEQIREYMQEIAATGFTADYFLDHYESNGWMVGKCHMKSWKATVRKWKNRNAGSNGHEKSEAEKAWDKYLDSLKRHHHEGAEQVRAEVGPMIYQCGKDAGGITAIDEGNQFDRKEQREKFLEAFERLNAKRNGVTA